MHLIEEAAKGKKNAASPEAADAAAGAIEQLVESDWVLARTAVNDVEGLTAADPKHQGKVDPRDREGRHGDCRWERRTRRRKVR